MTTKKLEQLKADLLLKASLDDVGKNKELQTIRQRLDELPANKMINAVNYLDSNILPAIKKRAGDASADYKFFQEVCDLLLWALIVHDRYKTLERRYVDKTVDAELLRERVTLYEEELNKYTTMEDLWLTEGLEYVRRGIAGRAEAILNRRTGKKT
jgi:hypothetical protein